MAGRHRPRTLVRDRRRRRYSRARCTGHSLRPGLTVRRPHPLRQGQPAPLREQLSGQRGADGGRDRRRADRGEAPALRLVREGGAGERSVHRDALAVPRRGEGRRGQDQDTARCVRHRRVGALCRAARGRAAHRGLPGRASASLHGRNDRPGRDRCQRRAVRQPRARGRVDADARVAGRRAGSVPSVKKDYFGEEVAARYDGGPMFSDEVLGPTVEFLAALAGDGAALELAIGTGRVALPLEARGVSVHGIDLSEAMVAKLREKPGAEQISATIGDFATTRVDGTFSLVYLVFNTIGNLTTQDDQVACFQNAAHHLDPGGCFVIEVGVPELQRLPPGETVQPFDVSDDHLGFDEYDIANQGLVSHHFWPEDGAWRRSSIPFRYVW